MYRLPNPVRARNPHPQAVDVQDITAIVPGFLAVDRRQGGDHAPPQCPEGYRYDARSDTCVPASQYGAAAPTAQQAMYSRTGNPLGQAPVECPPFFHNQYGELAAVQAMPVVSGGASVAEAVDVAYYTAYPNAPAIPEGWENSPSCQPWAQAWLRIRSLAKRLGKWGPKPATPTRPPPVPPAPSRARPRLKAKSRYNKLAKVFRSSNPTKVRKTQPRSRGPNECFPRCPKGYWCTRDINGTLYCEKASLAGGA